MRTGLCPDRFISSRLVFRQNVVVRAGKRIYLKSPGRLLALLHHTACVATYSLPVVCISPLTHCFIRKPM